MTPTSEELSAALDTILQKASDMGLVAVEVRSGNLYKSIDGYNQGDHRMPVCCNAMRNAMTAEDCIVQAPPKGDGTNLVVRYQLPR